MKLAHKLIREAGLNEIPIRVWRGTTKNNPDAVQTRVTIPLGTPINPYTSTSNPWDGRRNSLNTKRTMGGVCIAKFVKNLSETPNLKLEDVVRKSISKFRTGEEMEYTYKVEQ